MPGSPHFHMCPEYTLPLLHSSPAPAVSDMNVSALWVSEVLQLSLTTQLLLALISPRTTRPSQWPVASRQDSSHIVPEVPAIPGAGGRRLPWCWADISVPRWECGWGCTCFLRGTFKCMHSTAGTVSPLAWMNTGYGEYSSEKSCGRGSILPLLPAAFWDGVRAPTAYSPQSHRLHHHQSTTSEKWFSNDAVTV